MTKKLKTSHAKYTDKIVDDILDRLARGESLLKISKTKGYPHESTIRKWARIDLNGFAERYRHARELGYERLADEMLAIADTPKKGKRVETSQDGKKVVEEDMLGHRRLQVDTRKWLLSKMLPKVYGDKVSTEITGADGGPVKIEDTARAARIESLLAVARQRKEGKA